MVRAFGFALRTSGFGVGRRTSGHIPERLSIFITHAKDMSGCLLACLALGEHSRVGLLGRHAHCQPSCNHARGQHCAPIGARQRLRFILASDNALSKAYPTSVSKCCLSQDCYRFVRTFTLDQKTSWKKPGVQTPFFRSLGKSRQVQESLGKSRQV